MLHVRSLRPHHSLSAPARHLNPAKFLLPQRVFEASYRLSNSYSIRLPQTRLTASNVSLSLCYPRRSYGQWRQSEEKRGSNFRNFLITEQKLGRSLPGDSWWNSLRILLGLLLCCFTFFYGVQHTWVLANVARKYLQGKDSDHWLPITAEIEQVKLESLPFLSRGLFRIVQPQVVYSFELDDKTYQGNRISFSEPNYFLKHAREHAVKELVLYPIGKRLTVFYNPNNPNESVIHKGVQNQLPHLMFAGTGIGVTGILAWMSFLILSRRPRRW